jgi:type II secretory ATPase GspE/PulE/Tfp pilus assembly ATPase PilB-like protein
MRDGAEQWVIASLLEEGVLDAGAVAAARSGAAERRVGVLEELIRTGAVTREGAAIARAATSESAYVDLRHYEVDVRNARLLPRSVAERCEAFVVFDLHDGVTVGMADPQDLALADQVRAALRSEVEFVLCEPEQLRGLIARAYSLVGDPGEASRPSAAEDLVTAEEPIVAAVNQLLARAAEEGASDVHISPDEDALQIRYRIDGVLHARHGPARSAHGAIVQRLKVMAGLDLTQSRRAQDGKFRFTAGSRTLDVRVSVVPTVHGENAVLRLLSAPSSIRTFAELGVDPSMRAELEELTAQPHGIFLVAGPTGSGKTTTLYTALKRVSTPERNVMTIEDPVEIRLPGVRQVQVSAEIGMTFASALRSMLRQDPDVILLGEVRDEETARTALQAALTGHLVLATLHTNDAPGAVTRLRDLGCPAFAVNAALLGVLSQRLVRRTCAACAAPAAPDEGLSRRFGLAGGEAGFVRGAGCPGCLTTGYRGRVGIMELLRMSGSVRDLVERDAGAAALRREALSAGMKPIWRDGLDKARLGMTTLDEVARAVAMDVDAPGSAHSPAMRLSA